MSADDKAKNVTRYRLKQGARFGKITTEFDQRGVVIFTDNEAEASSWACEYHATLIVARTREVQEQVKRSPLSGWAKFTRLMELAEPSFEPIELTPDEALEERNR